MATGTKEATGDLQDIRKRFRTVARETAEAEREVSDLEARWPSETFQRLREERLTGLLVPEDAGGFGGGLAALVVACDELGRTHPSAGIGFGMHGVATACIAAQATPEQRKRYLEPIARGEHLTTLALSEPGTGVHFYLPQLPARRKDDVIQLDGTKSFVTNAGHVDSYVVSTAPLDAADDPGSFNMVVVDADAEGLSVGEPWTGFGMRGNSARNVRFDQTPVPAAHLLGREGAQTWYVFEVVAPYFIASMAGSYVGVAERALEEATANLKARKYDGFGRGLRDMPTLQHELADMWIRVRQSACLLQDAAARADTREPGADLELMAAKTSVEDMVVDVTNKAMSLGGGRAYGENGILGQLLRDARASQVMSPTQHLLKSWLGRALLGQPLLQGI